MEVTVCCENLSDGYIHLAHNDHRENFTLSTQHLPH